MLQSKLGRRIGAAAAAAALLMGGLTTLTAAPAQAAQTPTIVTSPGSWPDAPATGITKTFAVMSSPSWMWQVMSTSYWISAKQITAGVLGTPNAVQVTVSPNTSAASRSGYVDLAGYDSFSNRYVYAGTIQVTQAGSSGLTVSDTSWVNSKPYAATWTTHVQSNTSWKVTTPDWITMTSGSMNGSSNVTFSMTANGSSSARSGTITFTTLTQPVATTTIGVVQQGTSAVGSEVNDIPLAGDWNGNGTDTVGLYRPSNQTFYLRNSNTSGGADITTKYGNPGDIPIVGDWNGNGKTSIGVYRPSNATFYLRNNITTNGAGDIVAQYGVIGDKPVVGDWNGDGKTTIGVYRPSNSTFYLRNSNTGGVGDISSWYGNASLTNVPISGDWNGDGKTSIGLWLPRDPSGATSMFYLSNDNRLAAITTWYGDSTVGHVPVVGDWDGNRTTTLGVWSPLIRTFMLTNNNTGGLSQINFTFNV